ncbi:T9SS type A sorting domain-containing protein [Dyadobacter psychrotolerans]|uniref:T9SS type A sorting domain-containing protein n=1 Tax=Dyadobacter psychrotolerans TaxID=2541721 RepID=A0A4R5DVF9_9BACT|nr:T9SS type A sorting domain-containing protein [Dyadobacter psychrotolerans]TDE18532.1 T9SS type A sorting domain-containing protein [Dyadobacter psychrotolerans]
MLQSVQEKSGTKVIPPYTFTYFTDGSFTLPGYSKSHTNHWGFNNGLLINTATDFNSVGTYGTTYRSPATDVRHQKIGSIASIQYPTGGVTRFIFEPHTFAKEVMLKRWDGEDSHAINQRAGGLRIKEIHSYDNVTGPVVSKKYYYLSNFNPASPDTSTAVLSSGILGGRAKYYWPDYMPLPDNAGINVEEEIFSTQSVLPASENSMGSHLGYSQVVERTSTEGWTIHKFSNFDNGYRDNAPSGFIQPSSTPYQPYNSTAFQRGKTLVQERYFQNGKLASKSEISYTLVGTATDNARAVKASTAYLCNTFNSVFEATGYVIDVRKFFPSQEAKYTYDQDNVASFVAETASKSYWPNGQLYISGQTDSRGRTLKTWYKYPPNLVAAPGPAMTLANIIATPFEVFQYTGTEAAPSAIKLQTVTFNSTAPYLPSKVESKLGASGATNTDIEFLTYDPRGNLLTYKEKNGLTTKLDYYQTSDAGKTDLLKQRTLADGASRSQATSYNYTPLIGVQAITDPNSKTINYDYDEFGRLITVKNPNGNARASYCYNYAGQLTPCTALAPTGSIAPSGLVLIGIPGALPVTLVEFEATKVEKFVQLSWSTTIETNSERFDIERSVDGKKWNTLGAVAAKGQSSDNQNYEFSDNAPNREGENLYRLKMIDKDGTFAFSRIRSVTFNSSEKVALYPNPVTIGEKLTLLTDDLDKIATIKIFDTSGRMVHQSNPTREINTTRLAPGLYMVQITYTDGSLSTHRVVKQ